VGEDRAEVGLGGEVELVVHAPGAVGAQPHLGRRLLAGDVEGAALVPRGLGRDLEEQRALADAGLAGQEDGGARDEAAAEDPVELGHTAAAERRRLHRHVGDRHRRAGDRSGRGPRSWCCSLGDRPHAWHSPHRPTHFAEAHPHSEHR
jgi:hypothetical protein